MWSSFSQAKGNNTLIYDTLVSEKVWLNTSRPLEADDLQGRVVLVDFWTFCCINCIHVMPKLHALEQEFGSALTVIGVHSAKFANERDTDNIREAILRYGIEHPVVNDHHFAIWQAFGVRAWPTLVLIGPDGELAAVYSGEGDIERIREDIHDLLRIHDDELVTDPLPLALEKDKEPDHVLRYPSKIEAADDGFFIADSGHHRIVQVDATGEIVWAIGSGVQGFQDGDSAEAQFSLPHGLLYDEEAQLLYVADTGNHRVRRVNIATRQVDTILGTGERGTMYRVTNRQAVDTAIASPWDLVFYPNQSQIVIAMAGTHQLWQYDVEQKTVSVLAGNGREYIDDGRYPLNSLSQPSGLSVHGDALYFVDAETSSLRVLQDGAIRTLIGTGLFDFGFRDGIGREAELQHPIGVYADDSGVYIADSYNHAVRYYNVETGELTTIAGDGEVGDLQEDIDSTQFNEPNDILHINDVLYVVDTNNHLIQRLSILHEKVDELKVHEAALYEIADILPNVMALPHGVVAAEASVSIMLSLDKSWKINDDAPSFLTLFVQEDEDVYRQVEHWDKEALATLAVDLPVLAEDRAYRVQGSFYYCRKQNTSLCFVQSVDQTFSVAADGSDAITYVLDTLREE